MHHSEQPPFQPSSPREPAISPQMERLKRELETLSQAENLGATGDFPCGKLTPSDEGGIKLAVASDAETQKVIVNFGKPVAWIGFTPEQAIDLGNLILKHARKIRSNQVEAAAEVFKK